MEVDCVTKPSTPIAVHSATKNDENNGSVEESPVRTQRQEERVQLEDLNGRLHQYIMKQRAKDATREKWERDIQSVQKRCDEALSAHTKKYDDHLRILREQRDDNMSAREELQVRVNRMETLLNNNNQLLAQEKLTTQKYQERVSKLIKDVESRSLLVVKLNDEKDTLTSELENEKQLRVYAEQQVKDLLSEGNEYSHEMSSLRANCKSLEQDLSIRTQTSDEERKRLEAEIDDITLKNNDIESTVRKEFMQQLAEIVEDYRKQCADDKRRISHDLKAHYVPKLTEARTKLDCMSKTVTTLNENVAQLDDERNSLSHQLERSAELRAALEQRIDHLETQLEEERNDERTRDEINVRDDEIAKLRLKLSTLENDFEALMDVKIALTLEIRTYNQLLKEEEDRISPCTPARKRKRAKVHQTNKSAHAIHLILDTASKTLLLENRSSTTIDMSHWSLRSVALDKGFELDKGTQLEPKHKLRIAVGIAQEHIDEYVSEDEEGVSRFVWQDVEPAELSGDKLLLLDSKGMMIDSLGGDSTNLTRSSSSGDGQCVVM